MQTLNSQLSTLNSLGVARIPVPVPFPEAGGPANVYVIEERARQYLSAIVKARSEMKAAVSARFKPEEFRRSLSLEFTA